MKQEYIYKLLNEAGTPVQIRNLLNEFVRDFEMQNSDAWYREVKQTDVNYHCENILLAGRVDFTSKYNKNKHELTNSELICLFNYYYFPILLEGSYFLFRKIWDSNFEHYFTKNNSLIFIDLGCSTLPSSLAFSLVYDSFKSNNSIWKARDLKDEYHINSYVFFDKSIGSTAYIKDFIDKHTGMELESAKSTSTFFNHTVEPFYRTNYSPCTDIFLEGNIHSSKGGNFNITVPIIELFEKYAINSFQLRNGMDRYFPFSKYVLKYSQNLSFLLNISELRFSNSFDVNSLVENLNQIIKEYPDVTLAIIYQTFDGAKTDKKWEDFKSSINFKIITKGEFSLPLDKSKSLCFEILLRTQYDQLTNENI
jgi:hypothetical protein